MKQIILKTVTLQLENLKEELSYKKLFLQLVEVFPEGIRASEMGDAISISKKLQNATDDGSIFLENSEHSYLCTRFDNHRFGIAAPEIIEMREALFKAKDVETPHLASVNNKKRA